MLIAGGRDPFTGSRIDVVVSDGVISSVEPAAPAARSTAAAHPTAAATRPTAAGKPGDADGAGVIDTSGSGVIDTGGPGVIDAGGRWVVPGLVEAHGHVAHRGQAPLWLARGITTIREMWGGPMSLRWRDDVAHRGFDGPALICASPYLDGPVAGGARYPGMTPVTDADDATERATRYAATGFDLLKCYSGLTAPMLAAVGRVGAEHGVRLGGHVPTGLTFEVALRAGLRDFEHLVEFATGHLREPFPGGDLVERVGWWDAHLDRDALRRTGELLAGAGATMCPTLTVWSSVARDGSADRALRHVPEAARARWSRSGIPTPPGRTRHELDAAVARQRELVGEVARLLAGCGVRLRVGTDAGSRYVVPGVAFTTELGLLGDAGFTTREVLDAAVDGRRLTPGDPARLLVLDADPLADPGAATDPAWVVNGSWVRDRAGLSHDLTAHDEAVEAWRDLPDDDLGPMATAAWWAR